MRYVLRADAAQSTRDGRVMRSSAIAEELIDRIMDVVILAGFLTCLGSKWELLRWDLRLSSIIRMNSFQIIGLT